MQMRSKRNVFKKVKITINLKQGSINLKVHGAKRVREKVNLAGVKFWNYSSSILTF
jgi:hypothetical protein